jgi:hypothetical protein
MTRLGGGGWLVVALALAGVSGCSDNGPVAGVLQVSLTTPNSGADGAILLSVTGPQALTSVAPEVGGALRVFADPLSTTTKIAVTGPLVSGAMITIGVADVRQSAQYIAMIQAVAASDFQLRSLAGYSLTVSR